MRRVVCGLLGVAMLASLAACGPSEAKKKKTSAIENLNAIRNAVGIAYRDKGSKAYPKSIQSLVGKYLTEVPLEPITGVSTVVARNDGKGGWVYETKKGKVTINLQGKDCEGVDYSTY